jgi:AraC-like DNA-binding protein
MLCDEIVANGAPGSGWHIDCILPVIASSQKFVLGPEFAAAAGALSSDYTGLVKTFEHCRLPFERVWIELAHADRPEFSAAEMHAPDFQVRPRRVGFLLTATRPVLSKRTLARKLSDEGLNFTEILQQLRRDLAVRYLDDRKLHVSKIAWLLGFHQVSAFTHACKRWTGKTPSQMRAAGAF